MATQDDGASWLYRSYEPSGRGASTASTLIIAFGGLAGRLGGAGGTRQGDRHHEVGHTGVPAHEFVASCRRIGVAHALFCRDLRQAWYLRGTPEQPQGGWDAVLEALRLEIDLLRPERVVTLGSSMGTQPPSTPPDRANRRPDRRSPWPLALAGGYAAIRSAVELGADTAIAFAPQVLVDSTDRVEAGLPAMPFDDLLRGLKRVLWLEGQAMTGLCEVVARGMQTARERPLHIEVHVGGNERGDVREAEMLRSAPRRAAGCAATPVTMALQVWPGREHNVVTALRDIGQLDAILQRACLGACAGALTVDGRS